MRNLNECTLNELCVHTVHILSGVRPRGRSASHLAEGRITNGLLYIRHGAAHFRSDTGQTLTVGDGELVFLPKYQKYKMQYAANETMFVLINLEMHTPRGEECTLSDGIAVLLRNGSADRLEHVILQLEACGNARSIGASLQRCELIYRLLGMIYGSAQPLADITSDYPQITPGVRLLEQTYLENLPIEVFAKECGISISSFRSLFRKRLGVSPVQYRNALRIEHAKMLLTEGASTVSEAAYASGFENVGYFCKCYKRITKKTPGSAKKRESDESALEE